MCLVAQLCPTLYDPMDCSPPGSSVHGDSPGQEYWSGLPCHPPGDLPKPGMEPRSPALQADSLLSEPSGKPVLRLKMPTFANFLLEIRIRQGQSLSFLITFYKNFSRSKHN